MCPRKVGPLSFHLRRAGSLASIQSPLRVATSSETGRGVATAAFFADPAMTSSLCRAGKATAAASAEQALVAGAPLRIGVEFRRDACNPRSPSAYRGPQPPQENP